MTENKNVLPDTSQWIDPDDAPALTDEFFERAEMREGGKLVRRGRPPQAVTKKPISLRLDADVLEYFRSGGAGWQGRINETLKRSIARRDRK